MNMYRISETDATFGDWGLKVKLGADAKIDPSARMWLIVRCVLKKPTRSRIFLWVSPVDIKRRNFKMEGLAVMLTSET